MAKDSFFGRQNELNKLYSFFSKKGFLACLIYGRRRIGKSELIKYSIKDEKDKIIYFEAKQTTEKNNIDSLTELICEKLNVDFIHFNTIEEALKYLFEYSIKNKLILIIDEYSYLIKIVEGIDSIIQNLIDKYKNDSNMKLIISGSYIDIMKDLLLYENPLYGRLDLTINLKQMDYYDSSKFYSNFSDTDKVKMYSVCGGVPYYNKLVDDKLSVKENIINIIASNDSRLESEIQVYLKSEIQKMNNANEIFETLAKGYSRPIDILNQSSIKSGPLLIEVLNKLISMELVEKKAPINDENNKKKIGYYISDNLSSFYYKYIYRYNSQFNVMSANAFYDKYINDDFEKEYVPKVFEDICRQFLIKKNKENKIKPPFLKIGKYYYDIPSTKTNGEFDIVTEDENGYIFYEVKFRKNKLSLNEVEKEISQVNATTLNTYRYGFFSAAGFEEDVKNVIKYTLNDIYSDK